MSLSAARRTGFNLGTAAAQLAAGLVLSVVAARSWDDATFGGYAYLTWLAGTVAALGTAAFPALAVRQVAAASARGEAGKARRLAFAIAAMAVASTATLGLLLAAVEATTGALRAGGHLAPVVTLALASAAATVTSLTAQGAGRFDLVLRVTLPCSLGGAAAALMVIVSGGSPATVIYAIASGSLALALVLAVVLAIALPRGVDPGGPRWAEIRPYFLAVSALAVVDMVVWQKSEVFFLNRFHGGGELALYSVAFTLATAAVRMAPAAFAGVLTPAFAGAGGRQAPREELAPLFARSVTAMALGTAPLLLIAYAFGPTLLTVWGERFATAGTPLVILACGLALGNVSGVASAIFNGFDRADLLLKMGVVLATLNVGLDLALIPAHGALGAALASTLAQALSLPIAATVLWRTFAVAYPWRALGEILAATAAGALAATAIQRLALLVSGPRIAGDTVATLAALAVGAVVWRLARGSAPPPGVAVSDPPPPTGAIPDVSIVVPTKNRPDHLRTCLARVATQEGPTREVIVVDSSDGDDSAALIAAEFPAVRRVRVRGMPNNRHFAKNQGIRLARAPLVCFLDDDSFVEPGWLPRLLSHYADPAVGAVGGRIEDEIFGQTPTGEIVGGLEPNGRLHLNFTRHTGHPVDIQHFIGCNMSFRATALAASGGFDLAYGGPNFMEETDLCVRVKRLGLRIVFDPDALVHHANAPRDGGLKREALDPRGEFWSARSRAYFAWKLLPRNFAVLRYNALGFLKLHAEAAVRRRSWRHLRALMLQAAGLACGTLDWIAAGRPRVVP